MVMQNTDFTTGGLSYWEYFYIRVNSTTNECPQYPPTQGLAPGFGVSGSSQPNYGGLYGWVAWGKTIGGTVYWRQREVISYQTGYFYPPDKSWDSLRVWLMPGVVATYCYGSFVSKIILAIDHIVNALLPLLKQTGSPLKLPSAAQLPVPIP